MLNICLTFDYELFFGRTEYSVEEVLLGPTERIVGILDKNGVPATFFSDVPMCIRHRQIGLERIADQIDNQMIWLLSDGHDVQLHIHPFWFKAEYDGLNWKFDNDYYNINSFIEEKPCLEQIVNESANYLNNLLSQGRERYKCIGYRAGGFCIQPEREILNALRKNGIIIDSSICKGLYTNTSSHKYDFRGAPSDHEWIFDNHNGMLIESRNGDFLEIPIGSEYKIPQKWLSVHQSPRLVRGRLKGETSKDTERKKNIFVVKLDKLRAFFDQAVMMSLDSSHHIALEKMISNFVNSHDCESHDYYLSVIGHPKLYTENNYENMDLFLHTIKNNFHRNVSFCTITDVYNRYFG